MLSFTAQINVVAAGMALVATTAFGVGSLAGPALEFALDKSGTLGGRSNNNAPQLANQIEVVERRSFPTEREGFEPSVTQAPHRFSRPARSATPAPLLNN